MSTVLVTGGSGFIGSHCILQLLAAGYDVRATVRNLNREGDVRAMLEAGGAEPGERLWFFAADLEIDAGWREAVAGCEYVLHVASPFPPNVPRHEDELIVPAREGALRVLRASRDAGVKRVVLTSSFAAIGYGQEPQEAPFNETNWTDPDGEGVTAYVKSKTLAERAAWDFIAREGGGLELSVVNPVAVFGPVLGPDYSTSILLVQRLMDGAMPGCPRLCFGAVDVRDVAGLHMRAMTASRRQGRALPRRGRRFHVDGRHRQAAEAPHGRGGQTRADPAVARLAGAHRLAARSGGEADPARTRQQEERHQRKGQAHAGLGAAIERGGHCRHCRKPGAAGNPEGQREQGRLNRN